MEMPKSRGAKGNVNLTAAGRDESPRGKYMGEGKWHVRASTVFVNDEPL